MFGRPLLPLRHMRRTAYQFKEQSPSLHIENLRRYLLIAPSLVSKDPAFHRFCIRHPDLQPSNIIVRRSADSGQCQVVSLLDWQHASVLPMFVLAGIPNGFQNYGGPVSDALTLPSLPEVLGELGEPRENGGGSSSPSALEALSLAAFTTTPATRGKARLELKVALIEAMESWKTLTSGEASCPITFNAEDVRGAMELDEQQNEADRTSAATRGLPLPRAPRMGANRPLRGGIGARQADQGEGIGIGVG
ncbi:hypothetical protein PUNSTDRAFT_146340 [Punctularia strigosozonata HHB-11173 SS5]|uniref:Aminoglycoside phosphotransferase domain-containing protein n=1 Tax=Punctularia strigosozonata (strain HHB-11173) TaxID=741275 RepID=R7S4F7_PUNST|nr:uncharacterized protein PUNSTDRAFT_146340 [Punctularia strigosozonata HHB-11173 SS5]EIN04687.1 hypothetical protein PUNSTDRAFT_146340 [Punctularia strigosozonata HHB-11173 SS5]